MTVLYVAGAMRSGTTALGQALAASPDTVLLGEVRPVLLGLREPSHPSCDCGRPEAACAFWGTVADRPAVAAAARRAYRTLALPALFLAALGWRQPSSSTAVVVAWLSELRLVAGERTVVDTSKSVAGVLLWRLAGERVVVAQCVRSPRVVAVKQAATTARSGLPRTTPVASLTAWVVHHLAALVAGRLPGVDRTTVRYRTLVARPVDVVAGLWRTAGVRPGSAGADGRFTVVASHMLVGNPRRDRGGTVRVARRPDATARSTARPAAPPDPVAGGSPVVLGGPVGRLVH